MLEKFITLSLSQSANRVFDLLRCTHVQSLGAAGEYGNPRDRVTLLRKNTRIGRPATARGWQSYAASSSCFLGIPRSSKRRINVSSIKLLGQDAPAVMPTTAGPLGNQNRETTSRFS